MKKLKCFGIVLLSVLFLNSCSGPSERAVTAKDVEISGNANKYLKVVDGEYVFTNNGDDAFISVKFKLKSKPKAKNGDRDAMTEYTKMMEKANDLAKKLQKAEDELNSSQTTRLMRLQKNLLMQQQKSNFINYLMN